MRLIDADKIIYDIDEEGRAFVLAKDIDLRPTVEAEPVKIDIERFKKEIADYTDESGYVNIPLSILLNTLNEVTE